MRTETMTGAPVSLVSGAASGIGRHMAITLGRLGHRLVLVDVDRAGLDKLVHDELRQHAQLLLQPLDVRDSQGWERTISETVDRFGRIDTMLNIAGYLRPGYLTDIDADAIDKHIDINTKGVMYATRAAARQMVAQGHGHIINVASIAGLSHVPGLSAYCASKHAVRGFSLAAAHELLPHGVNVSVLCPDAVETPMLWLQEGKAEAALTFAARRALTLQEVETALRQVMRERPFELVLDVRWSGRALSASLSNLFPNLAKRVLPLVLRQGKRVQQRRSTRNPVG